MDLIDQLMEMAGSSPARSAAPSPEELLGAINPTIVQPEGGIFEEGEGPGDSADLRRIEALPRRVAAAAACRDSDPEHRHDQDCTLRTPEGEAWLEQVRQHMTLRLRRHRIDACECKKFGAECIKELLPTQGMYLYEAAQCQGAVGPIGVGEGKEGIGVLLPMVIPNCKVAVLLMPANLRPEFLKVTYPLWWQHFTAPSLADSPWRVIGRPVLHVMTYSELSVKSFASRLEEISPDVIIANEGHALCNLKSARGSRFKQGFDKRPGTRFFTHSGTLTKREPVDCAHLFGYALRGGSPLPQDEATLAEWTKAINDEFPQPIGQLRRLGAEGESAIQLMRRRIVETPGVIATAESALAQSVVFSERLPAVPPEVKEAMSGVRNKRERPDGDPLLDPLRQAKCLRELSCGLYYRWKYPRGEPRSVIDKWFAVRRAYGSELRELLWNPRPGLDSPLMCWEAAQRWHEGYTWKDKEGHEHREPPHSHVGPKPIWESFFWPEWKDVRHTVKHAKDPQWISDFLLRDAAEWLNRKGKPGIAWTNIIKVGVELARLSGFRYFAAGPEYDEALVLEDGRRSIICSIDAHGTGKNLQRFSRNLVITVLSLGKTWEQKVGRTHRRGQKADQVDVEIYQHSPEARKALRQACDDARYIQGLTGTKQKLVYGDWTFEP